MLNDVHLIAYIANSPLHRPGSVNLNGRCFSASLRDGVMLRGVNPSNRRIVLRPGGVDSNIANMPWVFKGRQFNVNAHIGTEFDVAVVVVTVWVSATGVLVGVDVDVDTPDDDALDVPAVMVPAE